MNASAATRDDLFEILDEVKDPEVPVLSVVELGIVRDARVENDVAIVTITPTYSGCPAMQVIEEDIRAALVEHGFAAVNVETVFAPAWTTDWLSVEAKQKLEAYGIAPPGPTARQSLVSLTRAPSAAERMRCPYCHSLETEGRSEFGSTACKAIAYCAKCQQPFEIFKAL